MFTPPWLASFSFAHSSRNSQPSIGRLASARLSAPVPRRLISFHRLRADCGETYWATSTPIVVSAALSKEYEQRVRTLPPTVPSVSCICEVGTDFSTISCRKLAYLPGSP
jgi:hypothetical protein